MLPKTRGPESLITRIGITLTKKNIHNNENKKNLQKNDGKKNIRTSIRSAGSLSRG